MPICILLEIHDLLASFQFICTQRIYVSSVGLMVYRMPEASGSHGNTEIQLYTHFAFMHCMQVCKFASLWEVIYFCWWLSRKCWNTHVLCSKLVDKSVMIAWENLFWLNFLFSKEVSFFHIQITDKNGASHLLLPSSSSQMWTEGIGHVVSLQVYTDLS